MYACSHDMFTCESNVVTFPELLFHLIPEVRSLDKTQSLLTYLVLKTAWGGTLSLPPVAGTADQLPHWPGISVHSGGQVHLVCAGSVLTTGPSLQPSFGFLRQSYVSPGQLQTCCVTEDDPQSGVTGLWPCALLVLSLLFI